MRAPANGGWPPHPFLLVPEEVSDLVPPMSISDPAADRFSLTLIGGFELRRGGDEVPLPLGAQRVLAFLAVHDIPLLRSYVAESLWPDSSRRRAGANLRSAMWRIRQAGQDLLSTAGTRVSLASGVVVDLRRLGVVTRRLIGGGLEPDDLQAEVVAALSLELLPDWFDEWLLLERDRWNQQRLHALEALAVRLLEAGRFSQAIETALAAVWAEPLRETSNRILIRVHAAEGNWSEALAHYRRYQTLLDRELRIPPTAQMQELIRQLTPR
jgi:DNA-binding SARP family transcriptional activator